MEMVAALILVLVAFKDFKLEAPVNRGLLLMYQNGRNSTLKEGSHG